jgi:hypothetical protein
VLLDNLLRLGSAQELRLPGIRPRFTERHGLDEADIDTTLYRIFQQRWQAIPIILAQQNDVEFYPGNLCPYRRIDSFQDATHVATTGHPCENLRVQTVETDIQVVDAQLFQSVGAPPQQHSISADADLADTVTSREADERQNPWVKERFATRKTDMADAEPAENANQAVIFFRL